MSNCGDQLPLGQRMETKQRCQIAWENLSFAKQCVCTSEAVPAFTVPVVSASHNVCSVSIDSEHTRDKGPVNSVGPANKVLLNLPLLWTMKCLAGMRSKEKFHLTGTFRARHKSPGPAGRQRVAA